MKDSEKLRGVRCFLLDMDGTFYLSDRLLEGALRFIDVLHSQKKEFLFLTNNSSKHRRQYAEKINRLGLPLPEELVFTAGEATALYLQERHPGASVYVVGTPALEDEFRQHGFELVEKDPQLLVLGFDTTLTYQKLWKMCDFARAGVPYIATHPDFNCPTETGYMPDIGAMIAFVKAATGPRTRPGGGQAQPADRGCGRRKDGHPHRSAVYDRRPVIHGYRPRPGQRDHDRARIERRNENGRPGEFPLPA